LEKKLNSNHQSKTVSLVVTSIVLASVGALLELILIEHYEGTNQLIPIISIGSALFLFIILLLNNTIAIRKIFSVVLCICAVAGVLGVYFHLDSNFQFEKEMRPNDSGGDLFWASFSGALPALAPMSMLVFTLLGFIYLSIINNENETK